MISTDRRVYTSIRTRLANCAFEPGAQIVIKELAAELRVSPIPVREALIRLAEEDVVDIVPGRGVYARRLCQSECLMDYELIFVLMKAVYGKVIQKAGLYQDELTRFAMGSEDLPSDQAEAGTDVIEEFYVSLLSIAGNQRYAKAIKGALLRTHLVRKIDLQMRLDASTVVSRIRTTARMLAEGCYRSAKDQLELEHGEAVNALPDAYRELVLRLHSKFSMPEPARSIPA